MRFILEIQCDNAAFGPEKGGPEEEVTRILNKVAARLYDGDGRAYDVNGNRVGSWRFEERD